MPSEIISHFLVVPVRLARGWKRGARSTTLIGIMLAATGPAMAINKCTGPDGTVAFQDAPCPNTSRTRDDPKPGMRTHSPNPNVMSPAEISKALNSQVGPAAERKAVLDQRRQAEEAREAAIRQQRCGDRFREQPYIGQSASDFLNCTAFAEIYGGGSINETESARGVFRQHVYPSHAGIRYVYTSNGVVTAIQR